MFPESFAEHWIGRLTKPGDVVLDPFSGRGTTAFQSLLMGRSAVANDINPVAYTVTRAKTSAPALTTLLRRISALEREYVDWTDSTSTEELSEFFDYAFSEQTLRQLRFLRGSLSWRTSDTDCMTAALILGALHGESQRSPSYLSNQMPRTISTKPAYSVRYWQRHGFVAPERDVFALLRDKAQYRYRLGRPTGDVKTVLGDMRELPRRRRLGAEHARLVLTSPPYLDVTNFEEDQWLRLWFLGGPPRPTKGRISTDDRHENADSYWSLIADFWRVVGTTVHDATNVVVRLGGTRQTAEQLVDGLVGTSVVSQRRVRLVTWSMTELAKRQTNAFRPGSVGCRFEVDVHLRMA
jgi:hypothetical protein